MGCNTCYEALEIATEVSERFIRSASLLPENAFLRWQINTNQERKHHVFAFSAPGVKITQEDFSWIFRKCGSAKVIPQDFFEDMWGEGRRIYALRYRTGDSESGENSRENTVVIFAGYPDKMEKFFSRNPGLRSRVPFQISFSDYSTDEMVQIVELEAKKRGFSIGSEAREKVASICGAV